MSIAGAARTPPVTCRTWRLGRRGAERGAIAIVTAFVLLVMIAMFGLALDLSRTYNRKAELQSVADTAAMVAASFLDGTPAGIDRAAAEAAQAVAAFTFAYDGDMVSWSATALSFGAGAEGGATGWVDAVTAKGSAGSVFFARVDTAALDPKHGKVANIFMSALSPDFAESNVAATAVAGRDTLNVLPLAICANSNTNASALPSGELVEYGFRRGVVYDLMNLNPGGRTPENFLVNPVAPPGTVGVTMKNRMDVVAPFVCTGKLAFPTLQGGALTVERGFPIDNLYLHLNSRFGSYTAPCQPSTAPADPVVKSFDLNAATWMKYRPDGLAANPLANPEPLLTVAEKPAGATRTAYGPLWTYAKAAKYADFVARGGVEPAGGYLTYGATAADWSLLYSPGLPEVLSYPASTPYQAAGGGAYKPGRNTRVLHVPLLRCPLVAGGSVPAAVVGIARFFMTVPATSSSLVAEFAGVASETALGGNVRLYR